jgi:hypothetical protein
VRKATRLAVVVVVLAFLLAAGWLVHPALFGEGASGERDGASSPTLQESLAGAPTTSPPVAAGAPRAETGTILVRVLDESGRPTDLVEVAAGIPAERLMVSGVRIGPGRFLVSGLDDAKEYRVGARAAACAPAVVAGIRPGGPEVTLHVRPAVVLHGVVEDAAGRPLPDARVRLTATVPGLEVAESKIVRPVDLEGRFRIEGLPRVPFVLAATEASDDSAWTVAFEGTVPEGQSEQFVRVVLDSSGVVEGRVLDPEGAPVEGIGIESRRSGSSGSSAHVLTGPDGVFHLRLAAGPCDLYVRDLSGLQKWQPETRTVTAPISGVEIRLRPAASPFAGVSGRFLFPGGVPPRGVSWALVTDGGHPAVTGGAFSSMGVRDQFRVTTTFPGSATLHVASPAGWARLDSIPLRSGALAPLGDVALQPGVLVRGSVVLPSGGPAAKALLYAPPFDTPWHGQPSENGSFEIGAFPPGEGSLTVVDLVHEPLVVPWRGGAGSTVDLGVLRLEPGTATVSVRVTSRSGAALPEGLMVELHAAARVGPRDPSASSVRLAAGSATFRAVASGRWTCFVHPPAVGPMQSGRSSPPFEVGKGARVDVVLEW